MAESQDLQQRQQGEWNEQPDEERRKKRHPGRRICAVAVRHNQRDKGDGDGRDRYPKPRSLLAKQIHWVCRWGKYSKSEFVVQSS